MRPPKPENENSEPLILETRRQVMSAVINALPQGREGAAQALGLTSSASTTRSTRTTATDR